MASNRTFVLKTDQLEDEACRKNHSLPANDSARRNGSTVTSESQSSLKIYLRMKPCVKTFENIHPTEVLCNTENSYSTNPNERLKNFTFTEVFRSDSKISQTEVFERSMKSQIMDFLSGRNVTVITYGAPNSGKTYTLYGTPSAPGIIPFSINLIFSVITCTLSPWYKPVRGNTVISLDESQRTLELHNKNKILGAPTTDRTQSTQVRRSIEGASPEVSEAEEHRCSSDAMYSLWISFAEIYNENVYDLLAANDEEESHPLRLITDTSGVTYVKGLTSVYATTALEAYQILVTGQSKMTTERMSDYNSSRSHTIFTMKLLRYLRENSPEKVEVGILTFCDLAGPVRSGEMQRRRLKEIRSINNSLLVLGMCLKAVYKGRTSKKNADRINGLFRGSKLTRVLQKALLERENVTFMTSFDPAGEVFTQTQSILNFCSLIRNSVAGFTFQDPDMTSSQKYQTTLSPLTETTENSTDSEKSDLSEKDLVTLNSVKSLNSPDSLDTCIKERNLRSLSFSEIASQKPTTPNVLPQKTRKLNFVNLEDYKLLKAENKQLIKEIEALKANALNREYEIRHNLTNPHLNTVKGFRTLQTKHTKDFFEERMDNFTHDKKRKTFDYLNRGDEMHAACKKLQVENSETTSELSMLNELLKQTKAECEQLSIEKHEYCLELAVVTDELKKFRDLTISYIRDFTDESNESDKIPLVDKLKHFIDDKISNIKVLDECLEEVKNDFVKITFDASRTKHELAEAKQKLQDESTNVKTLEEQLLDKANCVEALKSQLESRDKKLVEVCEVLRYPHHKHSISERSFDKSAIFHSTQLEDDVSDYNKILAEKGFHDSRHKFSLLSDDFFFPNAIDDPELLTTQAQIDINKKYHSELKHSSRRPSLVLDIDLKSANCTSRSSAGSSKNDSGIVLESSSRSNSDNLKLYETEDKATQTHEKEAFNENTVRQSEQELSKIQRLQKQVSEVEFALQHCQRERNDLGKLVFTIQEAQSNFELALKSLTDTIQQRDNAITNLRASIKETADVNAVNEENTRVTSEKIEQTERRIARVANTLLALEPLEKQTEKTFKREIYGLKSRLSLLKENIKDLKHVYRRYAENRSKLNQLKLQLFFRERELAVFKRHSVAAGTFDGLMAQVQEEIPEDRKRDYRMFCCMDEYYEHNYESTEDSLSESSSESLFSQKSNVDKATSCNLFEINSDEESQTGSTTELNCFLPYENEAGPSGEACSEALKGMSGWMKIKRIDAKTELSVQSANTSDF